MDLLQGFDSPDPQVRRVYWVRLDKLRSTRIGYDRPTLVICVQGEIMGLKPGESRLVEPGECVSTKLRPGILVHFWLIEFMLPKVNTLLQ